MSLRHNLERAFEAVIRAIDGFPADTVNVYRGADFHRHQTPCVVVWDKGGSENPNTSGNYLRRVTVIVKRHALEDEKGDASDLDPTEAMEALCDIVFGGLGTGDLDLENDPAGLAAKLTAAVEGLHVYHPVISTSSDPELEGVSFVESLTFEVYCCEGDIAEK